MAAKKTSKGRWVLLLFLSLALLLISMLFILQPKRSPQNSLPKDFSQIIEDGALKEKTTQVPLEKRISIKKKKGYWIQFLNPRNNPLGNVLIVKTSPRTSIKVPFLEGDKANWKILAQATTSGLAFIPEDSLPKQALSGIKKGFHPVLLSRENIQKHSSRTDPLRILMEPSWIFRGSIQDPTGKPLANIRLMLSEGSTPRELEQTGAFSGVFLRKEDDGGNVFIGHSGKGGKLTIPGLRMGRKYFYKVFLEGTPYVLMPKDIQPSPPFSNSTGFVRFLLTEPYACIVRIRGDEVVRGRRWTLPGENVKWKGQQPEDFEVVEIKRLELEKRFPRTFASVMVPSNLLELNRRPIGVKIKVHGKKTGWITRKIRMVPLSEVEVITFSVKRRIKLADFRIQAKLPSGKIYSKGPGSFWVRTKDGSMHMRVGFNEKVSVPPGEYVVYPNADHPKGLYKRIHFALKGGDSKTITIPFEFEVHRVSFHVVNSYGRPLDEMGFGLNLTAFFPTRSLIATLFMRNIRINQNPNLTTFYPKGSVLDLQVLAQGFANTKNGKMVEKRFSPKSLDDFIWEDNHIERFYLARLQK